MGSGSLTPWTFSTDIEAPFPSSFWFHSSQSGRQHNGILQQLEVLSSPWACYLLSPVHPLKLSPTGTIAPLASPPKARKGPSLGPRTPSPPASWFAGSSSLPCLGSVDLYWPFPISSITSVGCGWAGWPSVTWNTPTRVLARLRCEGSARWWQCECCCSEACVVEEDVLTHTFLQCTEIQSWVLAWEVQDMMCLGCRLYA